MKELLNTNLFGTFEYDSLILKVHSDNYNFFTKNRDALVSLGSHNSALYTLDKGIKYTQNEDLKRMMFLEKERLVDKMLEIVKKLGD